LPQLRDLTAGLESAVNQHLGDEITYTPAGSGAVTFNAWVETSDEPIRGTGGTSTARVRTIEVPKEIVPVYDMTGDRITIALLPDQVFKPGNVDEGEGFATWRITLARVRG
jgi:hypothetical protein